METQERLRQAIDEERQRLRGRVPADREGALLALVRRLDRVPVSPGDEPVFDLITGHRLANPGGNRALQLALEAGEEVLGLAEFSGHHLQRHPAVDRGVGGEVHHTHRTASEQRVDAVSAERATDLRERTHGGRHSPGGRAVILWQDDGS